jgi:hypothetical protein
MPSNESDRRDARERAAIIERSLAADRQGRDRLRARADEEAPPRDGPLSDVPNVGGRS